MSKNRNKGVILYSSSASNKPAALVSKFLGFKKLGGLQFWDTLPSEEESKECDVISPQQLSTIQGDLRVRKDAKFVRYHFEERIIEIAT